MRRLLITLLGLSLTLLALFALLKREEISFYLSSRDEESCLGCHLKHNPILVEQWRQASCGAQGGISCEACHGEDHEEIFKRRGEVSAKTCGGCHPAQQQSFSKSAHARGMESLEQEPLFKMLPSALQQAGCIQCHNVGRLDLDGSRGRCNACHSGHSFSKAEARRQKLVVVATLDLSSQNMRLGLNPNMGSSMAAILRRLLAV